MENKRRTLLSGRPVRDSVRAIAEQLLVRIESRSYKSRLPAERHLADEFGVPRNTVRGALDLLEENEIIVRHAGSGSFVHASAQPAPAAGPGLRAASHIAETTGPLELHVVRGIFEPELLRLAVIHMSPKDIEALRHILTRMEAIKTDWQEYARCEEEFYLQLARGTENPLLIAIYELVTDVRRQAHWRAQRRKMLSPNRIRESQGRHRSMFQAIEHRDIESAVEYVRLQLVEEQRGLMREG